MDIQHQDDRCRLREVVLQFVADPKFHLVLRCYRTMLGFASCGASSTCGVCGPGEVDLSGTVHDHVEGELAARFDDLGEQTVKNVSNRFGSIGRGATPVKKRRSQNAGAAPLLTDAPPGSDDDPGAG
jgi:hypothetical protein